MFIETDRGKLKFQSDRLRRRGVRFRTVL